MLLEGNRIAEERNGHQNLRPRTTSSGNCSAHAKRVGMTNVPSNSRSIDAHASVIDPNQGDRQLRTYIGSNLNVWKCVPIYRVARLILELGACDRCRCPDRSSHYACAACEQSGG